MRCSRPTRRLQLRLRLDPFHHHHGRDAGGKTDHVREAVLSIAAGPDIANERGIDLDDIDSDLQQARGRRKADAEIIDGDAAAERADHLQPLDGRADQRMRLGDFDDQAAGKLWPESDSAENIGESIRRRQIGRGKIPAKYKFRVRRKRRQQHSQNTRIEIEAAIQMRHEGSGGVNDAIGIRHARETFGIENVVGISGSMDGLHGKTQAAGGDSLSNQAVMIVTSSLFPTGHHAPQRPKERQPIDVGREEPAAGNDANRCGARKSWHPKSLLLISQTPFTLLGFPYF